MDVFWREAFDSGVFVGPRIFVCGNEITATGGHGTDRRFGVVAIEIDRPYEMRNAVREHKKNGVDRIKIMAGQLQQDELEAAIETARQRGLRVTAHTGGAVAEKGCESRCENMCRKQLDSGWRDRSDGDRTAGTVRHDQDAGADCSHPQLCGPVRGTG